MLKLNPPINENKSFNNFSIKEKAPISKINLRGDINNKDFVSRVGKILDLILPSEVGSIVVKKDISVVTTTPNEWLLISNDTTKSNNENLKETLFDNISISNLGAITDVTDQFTIFSLSGPNTIEVLSKSSPFNFDTLSNNCSAQTLLNNIDVIIIKKDNENIDLLTRRSFSQHLWLWLEDSSRFL
jgi:sarcosine oxidase, subunit gamma